MRKVKSCGVLVFRVRDGQTGFLVMKHAHRLDLPKGHLEPGETERQCALRELGEETGIRPEEIVLDEAFRHEEVYYPMYRRWGERVEKTLVVFLARLVVHRPLVLTEHRGYAWIPWRPPHDIQPETIDPLLAHVERWFAGEGAAFMTQILDGK